MMMGDSRMKQEDKDEPKKSAVRERPGETSGDRKELELRPELAAELLEPDQIVAAKRVRFGRKPLKRWERTMLWALRIYVIAMQIIVVIAVIRALHGA
jgi:hypothetical protein